MLSVYKDDMLKNLKWQKLLSNFQRLSPCRVLFAVLDSRMDSAADQRKRRMSKSEVFEILQVFSESCRAVEANS